MRTYHLLQSSNGPRRIWAAPVSPGYDDTRLSARETHRSVDRAGGAFYEAQWQAALDAHPDWIIVTSWNEWWENTQVESSARYGDAYVRATRDWASLFRDASARRPEE